LIGPPFIHHVSKLNHRSKIFLSIDHFYLLFFSREWKFLHPIDRNIDDDDEDQEGKVLEKKHMRFVILSNCASFLLGMGM
jgi:hypothetical protein